MVRLNRLLELNSWSTHGGAVFFFFAIVMVDGDINVDVVEIMIPFHSLNSLTLLAR